MTDPRDLLGRPVHDRDGADLGAVEHVYVEDAQPVWVASGGKLMPLAASEIGQDGVRLAVDRATVESAPAVHDPAQLDEDEQQAVYRHYASTEPFAPDPATAVSPEQAARASLLEDPRADREPAGPRAAARWRR